MSVFVDVLTNAIQTLQTVFSYVIRRSLYQATSIFTNFFFYLFLLVPLQRLYDHVQILKLIDVELKMKKQIISTPLSSEFLLLIKVLK